MYCAWDFVHPEDNFILLIMLYWDYLYEVQQLGVAVLLFKRTLISH